MSDLPWIIICPPGKTADDVPSAMINMLPGDRGVLILPSVEYENQQPPRLKEALERYSSILPVQEVRRRGWFRR